jgi:hypothetical protein
MTLPRSVLALDERFCLPLYAASNLIQPMYRPLLEPLGLTYAQYLVMLVLWEHDGISVRALEVRTARGEHACGCLDVSSA